MIETMPKPFAFVLIPFASEFDDIYKLGIKATCQEAGAYCERVDEQIFQENILERVYNQIAKADIVVADLTGRNPNVFYETGYAHALGKHVILLTQHSDDIPFDLKHYPHIIYEGKIVKLKDELYRSALWAIENPTGQLIQVDSLLKFYLGGDELTKTSGIRFKMKSNSSKPLRLNFSFAVQNASDKVVDATAIELGLILPREFQNGIGVSTVHLPGSRCMHLLPRLGRFLPNGWQPIPITVEVEDANLLRAKDYEASIRIFKETGSQDMNFNIHFR